MHQDSPFLFPPLSGNFDCSTEDLDSQIQSLANRLSKALNESTLNLKICANSKTDFNEECKEVQMRAWRLKKAWKANLCKQTWEEFRAARNYKGKLIKKALCQKGLSSLLIQMRTGKIGLRKYLHGRKVPEISLLPANMARPPNQ